MAEEAQKTVVAPAGTPININVGGEKTVEKAVEKPAGEPEQLREGRERARGANEVLKALGVKKGERARMLEEIKAGRLKLAEAKEEAKAAKNEAGDAKFELEAMKPFREENEKLRTSLKKYADAEFNALPEPLQKVIVEMKVEDPQARLDLIDTFRRAGAVEAKKVPAEEKKDDGKAAEAAGKGKSTTMANAAAPQSPAGPAANHYEQWKKLQDAGQPFLAAQFFHANRVKILEQRPR